MPVVNTGRTRLVMLAGLVCAISAGVVGIAAWRMTHRHVPAPLGLVPCKVSIDDPASGVAAVRLDLDEGALRYRDRLILIFADVQGSDRMVRSFDAQVDGKPVVPVAREMDAGAGAGPGGVSHSRVLVYGVPIPPRARSLTVAYTIDPTFFPPGTDRGDPADARSRLAADLGVVRSTSLLPRIDTPTGEAAFGVEFQLPRGWVAVTPWRSEDGRVVAPAGAGAPVEYLALGPFETRTLAIGSTSVQIATPALVAVGDFPVESIITREMELLAAPFKRPGPFLATVVPASFMHGGAAGDHSIVQSPAPVVLAHEVFHWWNDATLTAPDAGWFREGLTEYYGIRVARETGSWTTDQETACFADLDAEARRLEAAGPRSLREASLDTTATRLVYAKGALFWMLVDRRLRESGHYLEDAVRRVVTSPRTGLTTAELRTLFSSVYAGAVDEEFDRYVTGANRLPDLSLPPASGRSGCSRN